MRNASAILPLRNRTYDEIAVGARVPIVLTSRADSAEARAASTAIAVVMAHTERKKL